MSADINNIVQRLESVTVRLEGLVSGGSSASSSTATTIIDSGLSKEFSFSIEAMLNAFDDILNEHLKAFLDTSQAIGGDVATQAKLLNEAFKCEREFLSVAAKSGKPTDDNLRMMLEPLSQKIQAVTEFREKNRRSDYFNHLSAISESVSALGWVSVSPTPGPFVKEMSDASQFYTNRVLKDFKEKDPTHAAWVKAWLGTLKAMQDYIKQYHTTGVTWCAGAAPAAAASGGAPPPPPPPPVAPPAPTSQGGGGGGDEASRAALFSQINQGEGVTKGLKKVTDDMKTHKNPELRKGGTVPDRDPNKGPPTKPKPGLGKKPVSKPPKIELENNKWNVEFHIGNKNIVIADTEIKQSVYIYQCQDSTIQIKGKINSIVLDNCKKCALVADDLISAIDIINCQSVQTQVMGVVPIVNIDKTDGVQVYLSKDSSKAQIVTAKSSEMNILIPDSNGEFKEYSVPEQFKTVFDGKKLVTECTESV